VQLRAPGLEDTELVDLGRQLVSALRETGVPLLVNDRVDLVEAIGADGVHVGQDDLDPIEARRRLGPSALLGLSVQTLEHVGSARVDGLQAIDYLGVGPVWPQWVKLDAAEPVGLSALAAIVEASPWPCVAIGGVDAGRVAQARSQGVAGIAVVSAICGQPDVGGATRALRVAWDDWEAAGDGGRDLG